jgi:lipopolysaccharide transport system permease protein
MTVLNHQKENYLLLKDQISVLVSKDIKLKYNSTALGFVWSLLTPLFQSMIYFFIFKVIMRFEAENYLLYLLSGTFLWQFFANVVLMNGGIFLNNAGLLKKTAFPRSLLVYGTFCTESIQLLMTMVILLLAMGFFGVAISWTVLVNLPVILLALGLFVTGLSFFHASTNTFFRDMERIVAIVFQAWMMLSPVFIPMEAVPEKYLALYRCNPMTVILEVWRNIFYEPKLDLIPLGLALVFGGLSYAIGWSVFCKSEPRLAEMM